MEGLVKSVHDLIHGLHIADAGDVTGTNQENPVKTLFTIAALVLSFAAEANTTTRCVKNWDGSYTCTTTRNGGF
jgi:hypothetical protein